MKYIAIIPARYASTRFPGKPLALLNGKPVIEHVYDRAASVLEDVVVATDDARIYDTVAAFGGKAVMTSVDHRSGTDRCREAYDNCKSTADVVINVQGDEPFIAPQQIKSLMQCFDNNLNTDIATLIKPFTQSNTFEDLSNPNSPKVVIDKQGRALYFSRSIIPYLRGVETDQWLHGNTIFYKHIGIYAYRSNVLQNISALPPSSLEQAESLEQLRWLEHGLYIQTALTDIETIGIDTPEDLIRANNYLS